MTTSDFTTARRAMVLSQLRPQGISDPAILAAMGTIAREDHVPEGMRAMAYADRSQVIGDGAPMMAPTELGTLLQALDPQPGERALVIGAGGSYSAAVLEALGLRVERSDDAKASGMFDIILIEGGVEELPGELTALLTGDGRIGAAILDRGVGRLSIGRAGRQGISLTTIGDSGVGPNPVFARKPQFTF